MTTIPKRKTQSKPLPAVPLIVEHGLYSAEQILTALAISPVTLKTWAQQGLLVRKRGTKYRFYLGRDVIEFLRAID